MDNALFFNSLIQPKGGSGLISVFAIGILLVILVPLAIAAFGVVSAAKNTTLTLTQNELVIKSAFYGRRIPLDSILVDGVRKVNLNEETEYNLSIRTNGISIPQFKSGWMRLRNGGRALVFVTDTSEVVMVPTSGYTLLFSMTDIDEFIAKIKEVVQG